MSDKKRLFGTFGVRRTANDVLTFVDNRTNITTISSNGFNFNNSGNFPEINKTKTFMVFDNISVINGPIATLKPNTLIQYYRTDTIDDISYLMQIVTIADQANNIIYARKLTCENNLSNLLLLFLLGLLVLLTLFILSFILSIFISCSEV